MALAGKELEAMAYDAAHGFTNPTSPRYDKGAEKAAWKVIVRFIETNVGKAF